MKSVLILGGDGFCGWPTSLHLSANGYRVGIIDNLSRRHIDDELGAASLTRSPLSASACRPGMALPARRSTISISTLPTTMPGCATPSTASNPMPWCTLPSSAPRPIR